MLNFVQIAALALQLPKPTTNPRLITAAATKTLATSAATAISAAAVTLHAEAAHAKQFLGVNGQLNFGALSGDQPGGEGTGKALGINDSSLLFALGGVVLIIGVLFAQWSDYQDDDDDFFDTYDSRREDREITNRNRV